MSPYDFSGKQILEIGEDELNRSNVPNPSFGVLKKWKTHGNK